MQPKVSVIVPVYNVAPYLKRCLDSLIGQTLHELEIILIDDGSTDASGNSCDAYAKTDNRIQVVHQQNAGLSQARNKGIKLARAPYLMFVDSDDWVEKDFCLLPYTLASAHDADLVIFNAYNGDRPNRYAFLSHMADTCFSSGEAILHLDQFGHAVWNKCCRASLFSDFQFPPGRYYEDIGSTHRLIDRAKTVFLSNAMLYHYTYRKGSISRQRSRKAATDHYEMISLYSADLKQWGYDEAAYHATVKGALLYLMAMGEKEQYSAQCKSVLKAAPASVSFLSRKRIMLFHLYRFCPWLFHLVCILFKKRIRKKGIP